MGLAAVESLGACPARVAYAAGPTVAFVTVTRMCLCLFVCLFVSETVFATLSNWNGRVLHTCSRFVFLFYSLSANCKGYVLCAYL